MRGRSILLGLAAMGLLAASSLPASAQVIDDFLCSTFSYKCAPEVPPPPPQLAPEAAPVETAAKPHKKKMKTAKAKKATKAKAAKAEGDAPAAPPPDAGAK